MMQMNSLPLQSSLRNPNFASWKLDPEHQLQCTSHPLPSMVMPATTSGTDYAHARLAALVNCLMRVGDHLYTIVVPTSGTWQLCCIHVGHEELHISIAIDHLPQPNAPLPKEQPRLPYTMCGVQMHTEVQHMLPSTQLMLLSLGGGDLHLVVGVSHGPYHLAAGPLFPLPSAPPLDTVQPLCIAAAWAITHNYDDTVDNNNNNDTNGSTHDTHDTDVNTSNNSNPCIRIMAVVWTLHAGGTAADTSPCSVYSVQLQCWVGEEGWAWRVVDVEIIQHSSMHPFAVSVDVTQQRVLLATCPPKTIGQPSALTMTAEQGPSMEMRGEQRGGGQHEGEEEEVDPRTLQEAVQRLAQYTSDTMDTGLDGIQRNEWADIYREDDDPVPYPPCVITVHALNSTHHADGQHDGQDDGGQHDGGLRDGGASTSRWSVFASIDCGAHCVLTASSTDGWQHAALLGLTDDVDLAVVRLNAAAATPRACVEHVAEIPALAYVAAGKPAARYIPLATPGTPLIAAAMVESQHMVYVYCNVPPGCDHGRQLLRKLDSLRDPMGDPMRDPVRDPLRDPIRNPMGDRVSVVGDVDRGQEVVGAALVEVPGDVTLLVVLRAGGVLDVVGIGAA